MSCKITPDVGPITFKALNKAFGRELAKLLYFLGNSDEFQEKYKNMLEYENGFPTMESILRTPDALLVLGDTYLAYINRDNNSIENTIDNFNLLVSEAIEENREDNKDYVTIVSYDLESNTIVKQRVKKTEETVNLAKDLAATIALNDKLLPILYSVGIDITQLTEAEIGNGNVGITDFSKAKLLAEGIANMIRVANNVEGIMAIPEEASHLIIRALRNEPFVARLLSIIKNNNLAESLIDDYENVVNAYNNDENLIIEEAAGRLLHRLLLNQEIVELYPQPIFKRALNWIKDKIKKLNANAIDTAIVEAQTEANSIIAKVFKEASLTKEKVYRTLSEDRLNALTRNLDAKIKTVSKMVELLSKHYYSNVSRSLEGVTLEDMYDNLNNSRDEVLKPIVDALLHNNAEKGIAIFIKQSLDDVKEIKSHIGILQENALNLSKFELLSTKSKFGLLRTARDCFKCYLPILENLKKAYTIEGEDFDAEDTLKLIIGKYSDVLDAAIKELLMLLQFYYDLASPLFIAACKPFFSNSVTLQEKRGNEIVDVTYSIESIMNETTDISVLDKWLDSAANSSDVMIQVYDSMIREGKERRRLRVLDFTLKLLIEALLLEKAGVKDFKWMFETDSDGNKSGRYVSEYNYALFKKEKKEKLKELAEKYPDRKDVRQRTARTLEWRRWLADGRGARVRNPKTGRWYFSWKEPGKRYLNSAYLDILNDPAKARFYLYFMLAKQELDECLPDDITFLENAIKIRKNTLDRFKYNIGKGNILNFLKEEWKDATLIRSNEDLLGISVAVNNDFEGNRLRRIPIYYLYTKPNEDLNDISEDAVSTLILYANMAYNYEEMDDIINQLETGKALMIDKDSPNRRETIETIGGVPLVNKVKKAGATIISHIHKEGKSRWEERLQALLDAELYGLYTMSEGTIGDTNLSTVKVLKKALSFNSMAQLGLNVLAGAANVLTGVHMLNIEALAGEFYKKKHLAKADLEYAKLIMHHVAELGSRVKTNKLSLICDLFDLKKDYDSHIREIEWNKKFAGTRLLGTSAMYICQTGGDHWLYHRAAIAHMMMVECKRPDGSITSLWDAILIVDIDENNPELGKKAIIDGKIIDNAEREIESKGTTIQYNDTKRLAAETLRLAITQVRDDINFVNEHCFGIYDNDSISMAGMNVYTSFFLQYRKWIKPQYNYRFMKKQVDLRTGRIREGYWRTEGRFIMNIISDLKQGLVNLVTNWKSMKDWERRNCVRAMVELTQFAAVCTLAYYLSKALKGKKHRPYALRMLEYLTTRLRTELGALIPGPNLKELITIIKSPVAAASTLGDIINLYKLLLPWNYMDEMQSGKFEGHSTAWKTFWNAPIVPVWKQAYRAINPEESTKTYNL